MVVKSVFVTEITLRSISGQIVFTATFAWMIKQCLLASLWVRTADGCEETGGDRERLSVKSVRCHGNNFY